MSRPGDDFLTGRLADLQARVRQLVEHRRRGDPHPDDPFRGLYLGDDAVDQLLVPPEADPPAAGHAVPVAAAAPRSRLSRLSDAAGLDDTDVDLVLVAALPDLDSRYERLYGYLNDDVTRRRVSIGTALVLVGLAVDAAPARARLLPGGPLVDRGLVLVDDADRPFPTRALRVPDRVTAHLLGDDAADPHLADVLVDLQPFRGPVAERLADALAAGRRLFHLREQGAGVGSAAAAAALTATGRRALGVDLGRLRSAPDVAALITVLGREALLRGAGVVAGPVDVLAGSDLDAVRRLADLRVPVVLVGTGTWDPHWSTSVPTAFDVPILTPAERRSVWLRALDDLPDAAAPTVEAVPVHFVLGPRQIAQAVRAAASGGVADGAVRLDAAGLRRGARSQNAAGLERLARRVEPVVGWDDIVLPDAALGQLRELTSRARHRDRVLLEWGMRPGGGRGRGVTALFAGDSGTGKTMSAEVIAHDLGLDLYTVNLATVVDKYIGETEKNLERIFAEADGVNAVLLFDEADAIFGKRSEVRDAHDRYANIESAYLLQRMETFDGLAVLSTNLRSNIDDAFTRRLDMIVDFPAPDETSRLAIWERCLVPPLPCDPDLDLAFCARAFTLSGGNIRSAAITAAYLAAGGEGVLGMAELIAAVQQEYRKLGRLVLEREFGPYLAGAGVTPGRDR
ncbi:ATP-binding protein [Nakamurella deserti]|uniref:ATP-binding protein n=1 Tax=Nakamurella deserti TaxID=2164074 RepID=UPI000DBE01C5|nr:ATP-binding protein [Nakamurella deserti]